jgi:hypothetical protein
MTHAMPNIGPNEEKGFCSHSEDESAPPKHPSYIRLSTNILADLPKVLFNEAS